MHSKLSKAAMKLSNIDIVIDKMYFAGHGYPRILSIVGLIRLPRCGCPRIYWVSQNTKYCRIKRVHPGMYWASINFKILWKKQVILCHYWTNLLINLTNHQ